MSNGNIEKKDEDAVKLSQAMDTIAKVLANQRLKENSKEFEWKKLASSLDKLLSTGKDNLKTDLSECQSLLDVQVVEKFDETTKQTRKYALVPLEEKIVDSNSTTTNFNLKNKTKRSNSKITCSFCNEKGHKRANCEKRFQIPR